MNSKPFIAPARFETHEFVIRPYALGDASAIHRATLESYDHLKMWMPWAKEDLSIEEAEQTCRRLAGRYLLNEDFTLGIWNGSKLLGGTGFHLRHGPIESHNAEIGMWIHGDEAGKGLGTRVLEAMLQWGFTDWPWERIVWKCDTRNEASARVARKCGLKLEGTMRSDAIGVDGLRRDTHLYAILREEWVAERRR